MKKSEVPQDESDLANAGFRELCYATDEQGNYVTENSTGWEVKAAALSNAVERIHQRTEEARGGTYRSRADGGREAPGVRPGGPWIGGAMRRRMLRDDRRRHQHPGR